MIGFPTDVLSSICHLFSILSAFFRAQLIHSLPAWWFQSFFIRQLMIPIDHIFICSIFTRILDDHPRISHFFICFSQSFTMFSPQKMDQTSELRPSPGGPGRRESLLRRRGQALGAQRVVPAKPGGPGGPGSVLRSKKRNTVGCRHRSYPAW